ncbi:glycerophosphodiester phosphodiesterase family protein [Aquimarina sp. I32.4]|uniref:glycerophosphodiester phosphodiesterase n=1 Tax=Aquimarina sp. I32.4 TaxID=2053903 RepID=UPI000CDE7970|nr:glycerophosphodiester phosphodiesterase family protein [Aquimarina sp. I32.4]
MKIFGHRGAAGLIAENTLESVKIALLHNVDGIEIDIHCCKTGELVVIHDETLDRTTNGKGNVREYSLEELKQYSTQEGYAIPTLDQVLDIIDAQCLLNIELKGKDTVIPTIKVLEKYINNSRWEYKDFIISSFDHDQLFDLKEHTSRFKIGVLTEESVVEALPIAKKLSAFSIHPPIETLTRDHVNHAKEVGFHVYVWTVNEKELIKKSKFWKVEGIITDFPNFVTEKRNI